MTEIGRSRRKTISRFLISLAATALFYFAALATLVAGIGGGSSVGSIAWLGGLFVVFSAIATFVAGVFAVQLLRQRCTMMSGLAVVLAVLTLLPALGVGYMAGTTWLDDRADENRLTEISAETLIELVEACDVESGTVDYVNVEYWLVDRPTSAAGRALNAADARPYTSKSLFRQVRDHSGVKPACGFDRLPGIPDFQ